jgi:hypothetical protein
LQEGRSDFCKKTAEKKGTQDLQEGRREIGKILKNDGREREGHMFSVKRKEQFFG